MAEVYTYDVELLDGEDVEVAKASATLTRPFGTDEVLVIQLQQNMRGISMHDMEEVANRIAGTKPGRTVLVLQPSVKVVKLTLRSVEVTDDD
jgi:hypothetical protein